jgi:hypothetical protein
MKRKAKVVLTTINKTTAIVLMDEQNEILEVIEELDSEVSDIKDVERVITVISEFE